jgi:hypothetical protein
MSLIGLNGSLYFISFIMDGGLRSGLQKKISGISNKMFTQTVRELEKMALFQKNFPVVLQSGIQIEREEDRSKIFCEVLDEDNPN